MKRYQSKYDGEQELRAARIAYGERIGYFALACFVTVMLIALVAAGLEGGTQAPLAWLKELFD